ncbi:AAA family ATPase [Planktothrix sp. FACHB-1355]|uniref:AAA family ATPase n=1 Tax=Aerosakkonema funiforme FACHB-1375 TaxID=2949571 RepID=A0A926VCH6_9CYAN|nr:MULTISPECIES: AAA domain-containing protein [Oscillatoriales]MBD2180357.1 AAA family ATPase [Aerosakkonema funiforme FACHB-1375]MBD3557511.1 AAA family ATPase [Planktothrix sp. FACHB-1355]
MKLFDLKFGKLVSGRFLARRIVGSFKLGNGKNWEKQWEDKIVELQRIDEDTLCFQVANDRDSETIVELEPDSTDAKILLSELESGHTLIVGCIMKATDKHIEIEGRSFNVPNSEIPVQLQVALTDEFIETVVMRNWRNVKNFNDSKRRLEEEFILDKLGYWFVTSGAKDPEFQKGFSVLGKSWSLNLTPQEDGQLVTEAMKRQGRNLSDRAIYLMRQPLEFCDQTVASKMRSAAISALSKVVQENDSWIASWKRYNTEENRILKERFGLLSPLPYQGRPTFIGEDNSRNLLTFDLERSANITPWLKHISGDGLPVTIQDNASMPEALLIGYDHKTHRLTLVWEGEQEPPKTGEISPSMALEQSRIQKREKALTTLETARSGLPYLGLILEGKPFNRAIPRQRKQLTKAARKIFGETGPTPAQEKALRIALSTPDIALIQGPPGTGKTRVIQALLTMLNEGRDTGEVLETVLVTSLQHEAVDNAIASMSIAGLPVDRLGGKKGEDRGSEMIQAWRNQVIQEVRSHLSTEPSPTLVLIDRLKGYLSHWRTSAGGREGTHEILLAFRNAAERFLSVQRISELDRLASTAPVIQKQSQPIIEDPDDRDELERRLNQQCTTEESFKDDGNRQARRLRRFLEPYLDNLSPDIIEAVEVAVSWNAENTTYSEPWLSLQSACIGIRQQLLEIPVTQAIAEQDISDVEIEQCLLAAIEEIEVVRAQSEEGIQEALELFVRDLEEDPNYVREVIRKYAPIQATSCGQADSKWLGMDNRTFTLVIVDEAARANPLDLLIPMVKGRRIILVGDHKQLPHVLEREIEQSLAKEGDEKLREVYGKSLFERLWASLPQQTVIDGIERTAQLTDQFRMHPTIGKFVSDRFYTESPINSSFVKPEARPNYTGAYNQKPVVWLDVPANEGGENRAGKSSWERPAEVSCIVAELRHILPRIEEKYPDFDPSQPAGMVGVIAFYSAQEEALKEAIANPRDGLPDHLQRRVRVGTVDAFQGREYDVVYLSTVRSNQNESVEQRLGFTALPNRLCVAFSRARCVLIGVGDAACVAGMRPDGTPWSEPLKAFIDLCSSEEGYADI